MHVRSFVCAAALVVASAPVWAQGTIGGCQVYPSNNIWNKRVDALPVEANSESYLSSAGRGKALIVDPSIPINVVEATQPLQKLAHVEYADESDIVPMPIPDNPQIETGNDAHILIVQRGTCRLYEIYAAKRAGTQWAAAATAVFDLHSNKLRPDGWTSTDAAGMSVASGLLRYEEIKAGAIRHALRFTMPKTQRLYVWPARHFASKQDNRMLPPMGLRIRLKKDFDMSGYSAEARVVLTALRHYGAFLADNGGAFMFTATPDGWPPALITELHKVTSDAFEAVDTSELMVSQNSGQAGPLPSLGEVELKVSGDWHLHLGQGNAYVVTLTGNTKLVGIDGATPGEVVTLRVCQDATGARTLTWPASVHGAMKIGAAASKCSVQQFVASANALYASAPGVIDQ